MTVAEFRELCKKHDLTYNFSDDSRSYNAGRDSYAAIRKAADELPAEVAIKIWNEIVDEKLAPGHGAGYKWG